MRTTFLVCYDVADDKRLRRAFKTCRNFGDHLQYSVFECDLNPSEKIELEDALSRLSTTTKTKCSLSHWGHRKGEATGSLRRSACLTRSWTRRVTWFEIGGFFDNCVCER